MAPATVSHSLGYSSYELPSEYLEPRWYAAYICANHEKRVAALLDERRIEHFLPLYATVHRWRDRYVHLQLPLFPGYVFVHLPLRDRLAVLRIPSVVHLVGGNRGMPEPLPEEQIETLQSGLRADLETRPHPFLTRGRRVRIKSGPLSGMEGILEHTKRKRRVVLSVELIMRSIAVEVDAADIERTARPS